MNLLSRVARPSDINVVARQAIILFVLAILSRFTLFTFGGLLQNHLGIDGRTVEAMCQWDCNWYLRIIEHGYPDGPPGAGQGQSSWAFFPLFPMLASGLKALSPLDGLQAGFVVSALAFGLTVPIAFLSYRRELGEDRALFLSALLIVSPISLYATVPYTEALFGLLLISSVGACLNQRWILAGLCLAGLSATRAVGVFGCFMLLSFALMAYGPRTLIISGLQVFVGRLPSFDVSRVALGFVLAPAGFFAYVLFLHLHVGDGFAFRHVTEAGWSWSWDWPTNTVYHAILASHDPRLLYLSITAIFGFSCFVVLLLNKRYSEAIFYFIIIFVSLSGLINSNHRYLFGHFLPWLAIALLLPDNKHLRVGLLCFLASSWSIYLVAWLQRVPWTT